MSLFLLDLIIFKNGFRKLQYFEFWLTANNDAVLQADCSVVLALNSIINTACGSNAISEHLGHMRNIITQGLLHPLGNIRGKMLGLSDRVKLNLET